MIFSGQSYIAQWSLRPRSTLYCLYISSFSSTSSDVNGVITYIALLRSTIASLFFGGVLGQQAVDLQLGPGARQVAGVLAPRPCTGNGRANGLAVERAA